MRDILHEKHARGVWRSSLASVRALPTCPPDMTEPQYARLAFDDYCHFCLASGVEDISWVCRVRCCQKCLKKQFISQDELDLWLPESLYIEQPDLIFPYFMACQKREGRHKPIYFLPTVQEYLRELNRLADDATLAEWSQEKKDKQAERVQHASQCEYWHTHWAFRASCKPSPSYLWELALVVWLSILLMGLWRDKFMEIAGRVKRC
ncbi:hypothetical protein BJ912DRAFT_549311 [Pholiota molesta]|nr:hypothetical protein BJ912DRAFT_549311 [Pholiota molesta]